MPATQSISFVKAHLAEVCQQVQANHAPVVVTQNGVSTVVIQDHASYERTRAALVMLKLVAMGEADVARGRTVPQAEVFGALKKRLKERITAQAQAQAKSKARATT
jgi:prevent-host-death family protein